MYDISEEELSRYSRHILLREIGVEGQARIGQGSVLVVGVGGLGSPVALYLAAAGVGRLGLVDGDVVDRTNLQRQVIHFTDDIGRPKVLSAKEKIARINPHVRVETYEAFLTAENALQMIETYDFVVDATDSFAVKFLINDACVMAGKPYSHGGVLRFEGETFTYVPGSACYRCLFNAPPPAGAVPTCAEAGVLGVVPGMLGTIQAAEALKYLAGTGELLTDRLLMFDAAAMTFRTVHTGRDCGCPVCGTHPSITRLEAAGVTVCDMKKR